MVGTCKVRASCRTSSGPLCWCSRVLVWKSRERSWSLLDQEGLPAWREESIVKKDLIGDNLDEYQEKKETEVRKISY